MIRKSTEEQAQASINEDFDRAESLDSVLREQHQAISDLEFQLLVSTRESEELQSIRLARLVADTDALRASAQYFLFERVPSRCCFAFRGETIIRLLIVADALMRENRIERIAS